MKKFTLAIVLAFGLSAQAQTDEAAYEALINSLAQPEVSTSPSTRKFSGLSTKQSKLLVLAHDVAKKDGHKEPKLLQGLLMQETRAGADPTYKQATNRCYGVLQIKIAATQDVLKRYPELLQRFNVNIKDQAAIKHKLIHDDEFNLVVGSRYLLILKTYGYSTMSQLALAWNQGAGGAKRFQAETFPYVRGVMKNISTLYASR